MERDEKGRFKSKTETEIDLDVNRRAQNGLVIRFPFPEYIPFFLMLLCFVVVGFPWILIVKPLLRKVMKLLGEALVEKTQNKDGW